MALALTLDGCMDGMGWDVGWRLDGHGLPTPPTLGSARGGLAVVCALD